MQFAWVGFHREGLGALTALLAADAPIRAMFTLRPDLAARRSGGADYRPVCEQYGVPLHYVANINDPSALNLLREIGPDVVFVIGWHQIVRPEALRLARMGWIGAHASLLPHNRGSAPINWAVIRGEHETGNTLFWLSEALDAGDIVDQKAFPITPYDTCATLYEKVAESNRDMLSRLLPKLLAGDRPSQRQPRTDEPVLTRRRAVDGRIDWSAPSHAVYDFIRALTRPYPGAFGTLMGRRWLVWQAALPPAMRTVAQPGTVLGPIVSPVSEACGVLVACGESAITLLELEGGDGTILMGRALSDQPWAGERWTHGD